MKRLTSVGCLVGVAVLLVACGDGGEESAAVPATTSNDGIVTFADLSREHTEDDVDYAQSPPAGGEHDPAWLNCNGVVYAEPVRDERAVHSLEHGAVWVTYDPALPDEDVQALQAKVEGQPYTLLSPYPDQPSPVMATAWGAQLSMNEVDEARLDDFLTKYRQGQQTPEPGAPCDGGVME